VENEELWMTRPSGGRHDRPGREAENVGFVLISDGITVVNPDHLGPYYLRLVLELDPGA
jgi:hypothetical protein